MKPPSPGNPQFAVIEFTQNWPNAEKALDYVTAVTIAGQVLPVKLHEVKHLTHIQLSLNWVQHLHHLNNQKSLV